ncbi:iron complex transport system ATP-binding protein [Aquabacterium commune]|uniref:Iron complex transport system ATP-binding protein n=1 Tax=Aquabacterium commune TaxID=70586 RepID=A0A4R6RNI0_9BURK|nr:ABC transporter ATP-binding protein [Aquabacterium commune]TDP88180.1 iron complex transport system ATP-binding protein [Aquabacterium commune]
MSAAPNVPVLQARELSVQRGQATVVRGVSLAAHAGQWLAIVGPNGAGKSSLLQALAGLWPVASGEVLLHGQSGARVSARRHAREHARQRARQLAWMGQTPPGDEALSVDDTVALGRLPHQGWWGWPAHSAADREAIEQALQDTDLLALRHRALQALSGGERQRAHLARALATQAPVLLLDEPSAHLDAPHQRLLAQVLRTQAQRGRAVVSVLHELPLALAADRIAVMQSGVLLACGDAGEPAVHRAIETVFAQAVRIAQVDGRWTALPCY